MQHHSFNVYFFPRQIGMHKRGRRVQSEEKINDDAVSVEADGEFKFRSSGAVGTINPRV